MEIERGLTSGAAGGRTAAGIRGNTPLAPLRDLFELTPLSLMHHLLLAGAAVQWAVVLWGMWRTRLIERFLELES